MWRLRARTLQRIGLPGLSSPASHSLAQVERHQVVVLEHAPKRAMEVITEALIVLKPPEGGPGEDDVRRTGLPQPLQLTDRCLVIRRRPPVRTVPFQERDNLAILADYAGPLVLIDEDEPLLRGDERLDLARRGNNSGEPGDAAPRRGINAEAQRVAVCLQGHRLMGVVLMIALELLPRC